MSRGASKARLFRRAGRHRARATWVPVAVTLEVVALGAVLALLGRSSTVTPTDLGVVPAAAAAPITLLPSPDPRRAAAPAPTPAPDLLPPQRLRVPSLGIDAAVQPVGTSRQGALTVPDDVRRLGWWQAGALPGASAGTVVIDGHVDSKDQGKGQFFVLERATPGTTVSVLTAHGETSYRVVARTVYAKQALPADLFDRTGRHRLVLITCGGPFDARTGHYRDNVVVYAVPA